MKFEVYDIETLSNLFTYTGYDCSTKQWHQYVICSWRNDLEKLYKHLLTLRKEYYQIGFNNDNFDYPVLHNLLNHYENYKHLYPEEVAKALFQKAQELIEGQNEDGKQFNTIADKNKYILQLDLFKIWHYNNKARATSLKALEIAMNMPNVEDMPLPPDHWCVQGDEDIILSYNKNDVEATLQFFRTTLGKTEYSLYKGKNKLKLRESLKNKFKVNVLNMPDVKMGEELMLNLYARAVNKNPFDIKKLRTNRTSIDLKDCIPHWCNVKSNYFKKFLDIINKTTIPVPIPEKAFNLSIINYDIGYKWDFGLGGSHGCCEPGVYESNNDYVIMDYDVGSLYPSIANSLQIYPEHLGPEFIKLYSQFIVARLTEKHKPKEQRDMPIIEGYKLMLNGAYGKSNEETSFLYDPLYTFKTTIAGQLFVCMWSERWIEACPEIKFLQTNTDGQTILIPRSKVEKIRQVNEQLTKETTLTIEEVEYSKMIIRDVNNYIAVYSDSTKEKEHVKLKGDFEIDKEYHKDPSMRIVPLAVKEYFVNGIPIDETIRNHKNIYDFCLRLKVNSGCTAKIKKYDSEKGFYTESLSKNTRYYVSNSKDSGSLLKCFNDGRITGVNVGYSSIIFNKYKELPMENYKINYNFYITEANKLINSAENKQLSLF
jgi:hypothetical protein